MTFLLTRLVIICLFAGSKNEVQCQQFWIIPTLWSVNDVAARDQKTSLGEFQTK